MTTLDKPLLDTSDRNGSPPTSLRSRMDSVTASGGSRRNNQRMKTYSWMFLLVFTATVSIYRSSSSSKSELSIFNAVVDESQQLFAPSRLEVVAAEPDSSKDNAAAEGDAQEEQQQPTNLSNSVNGEHSNTHEVPTKQTTAQAKETKSQDPNDDPIPIDKPLNVLLLYADDWRHDSLGVASNSKIVTPFLDWLSTKQGIRFTHNCVTTSVCWISRATLHTGQYYSRHQATRPKDNQWYQGFADTYPAQLRDHGYHVGHIGKWHSADFGKVSKTYHHQKTYYGRHWFPGNPRPVHVTERNEQDGLDFLQKRPKDKPFALTLAFFAPHSWDNNPLQYLPQNKSLVHYNNDTFQPPYDMEASYKKLPKFFQERNEGRHRYRQRFTPSVGYGGMTANYMRLITEVDQACQAMWNELERQGILNETTVIFTTDNGYYLGEHGLAGKWYPHEESIRVPLIVHDPRMPPNKRGTTDDSFTLNIDLAPTILGAANVTLPATYQGRDISDLYLQRLQDPKDEFPSKSLHTLPIGDDNHNTNTTLNDRTKPWRTEFFYEHPVHINQNVIPASSALVRKNIKYIHWPNWDVEQIFNLTSDPLEQVDQILNPEYAAIHGELKARHDALRAMVGNARTVF